MRYVKGLVCISCQKSYAPEPDRYLCSSCGKNGLLDVKYDYSLLQSEWSREQLQSSTAPGHWRYLPLLPVDPATPRPPLRVGGTPLYHNRALGEELGLQEIIIKDEGLNPTASLKDRASSLAVVKAREAGNNIISCSSTGNAASSLAGSAAASGLKAVIFVPERAPGGKVAQLMIFGARVISVQGSYSDTYELSAASIDRWHWYNRNAAINPYLMEGKKTSVLELAEQLNWQMPDWIVLTVGDGCTIAGAGKALQDLRELDFITRKPRLLGVQAAGCAPITRAWQQEAELQVCAEDSLADSIAVGNPRNWKKAVRAVRNSGGTMINVEDEEILEVMKLLGRKSGIFGEPAGVAGLAGIRRAVKAGIIQPREKVAVIITGNGLKDIDSARQAAGEPYSLAPEIGAMEEVVCKEGLD